MQPMPISDTVISRSLRVFIMSVSFQRGGVSICPYYTGFPVEGESPKKLCSINRRFIPAVGDAFSAAAAQIQSAFANFFIPLQLFPPCPRLIYDGDKKEAAYEIRKAAAS